MNYSSFIVKVLKITEQSFFENAIPVTELIGKFYQYRENKNSLCKLTIWGNLSSDVLGYFTVNDYLIVEGYISLNESVFEDLNLKTEISISVFKAYPYALTVKEINK